MPTKKATVYFTCEHDIKQKLAQFAEDDGRSLSNLMERIALEWLRRHENESSATKTQAGSISKSA